MNNLVPQLSEAAEFLEKYPKLGTSSDLAAPLKSLETALGKFLAKAEDLRLEQLPAYAEVAALLEGDARSIADPKFMEKFCRTRLKVKFTVPRANRRSRAEFLKRVAREGLLLALKNELDPNKRGRDLFDQLRSLDATSIRNAVGAMTAKDLTLLADANGFTAPRTGSGLVSRNRKALDQLVSQIQQVKLSEHY